MSQKQFQAPRGTSDILPEEQVYWRFLESRAEEVAAKFGYERINTPAFENANLFVRSVGAATDIVEKETYTFEDRGGDLVSLRPEGTAPVCRAYLQHGMHNLPQPVRLFYMGDFFRYDRPQAGRYRQFHQFGIEVIGEADASVDSEVIDLAWSVLESVGVKDVTLLLNSIGDAMCRPGYIDELRSYYRSRVSELVHDDCKRRLETNPLRLLDCKNGECQPLIEAAPGSVDYLCGDCSKHWDALLGDLNAAGRSYKIDKRLVRGLDYYSRTVFEIVPPSDGQQSTLVAGGRYDGLIELLGGRPTPGIGFALGIERVLVAIPSDDESITKIAGNKIIVAHMGDESKSAGVKLCSELRRAGIAAVLAPPGRSLKSQLRYASFIRATHAVIIGDRELESGSFMLRNLGDREQREIPRDDLVAALIPS
ncbi:MAG: histidine--tRNA ligase [SAR202 cluster bacterium]|nr:histidine--tRNA ligase [SAR202 cluster bacterium]